MQIRVLGPLEVVGDDGPVVLGGPKQRAVLAMLALSPNRVVSTERLIDGVWGEDSATTALATLQVYVSNLRKALTTTSRPGSELIVGRRPGYVLVVPEDAVDLGAFEALVEAARRDLESDNVATAAATLHEALGLWRGAPLADLDLEPFAQSEVVRLDQIRLGAWEDRIDADLALGRHRELVPELEGLVAAHPLRERMWGQLIVALYRSERQADALAAYARARDGLVDELGIDPGPALQELERAILAQDLDVPAPVARTAAAPVAPVRIPVPASSLVGREAEIADLVATITSDDTRLVTLTGPGGMGKTRLAFEVARRSVEAFPGGVSVVQLAAVTDPAMVVSAIAKAVGVEDPGDGGLADALSAALHDRRVLLVLDNLEQVLDAAADIGALLTAAPGLSVIATSRIPLRITGEREHALDGLSLPAASADVDAIGASDAVSLFAARARDIRPDFLVTADNASVVAEICRRLDGVPLAVELAAARTKLLSVEAIRTRLDDSLTLLSKGARDAPERHQTLRAAIDWSVGLLSDEEQGVLAQLSVFVEGCFLDAADAVCGGESEEALSALIDSSLLRATSIDDEPWFRLPEVVRQYARDQLADPAPVRERHLAHFLAVAEAAAPELDGPRARSLLAQSSANHGNYRAAFDTALEAGDIESAGRLGIALTPYWLARGWVTEGRGHLAEIVAAAAGATGVAAVKVAAGRLAYQQTDVPAAQQLLTEALEDASSLDEDTEVLARCLLAAMDLMTGSVDAGRAAAERALEAAEAGGHYVSHVVALSVLAIAAAIGGDLEGERARYERRLALARRHGDAIRTADTLITLGEIALDLGETDEAKKLVREGFEIANVASKPEARDALMLLGRIAVSENDLERAEGFLDEALVRAVEEGQSAALALCLRIHAAAATLRGDWERAARLFGGSDALRPTEIAADLPGEADLTARMHECRDRLGDAAYESARAAGVDMTQLELVTVALSR